MSIEAVFFTRNDVLLHNLSSFDRILSNFRKHLFRHLVEGNIRSSQHCEGSFTVQNFIQVRVLQIDPFIRFNSSAWNGASGRKRVVTLSNWVMMEKLRLAASHSVMELVAGMRTRSMVWTLPLQASCSQRTTVAHCTVARMGIVLKNGICVTHKKKKKFFNLKK